jgi:hypothetical protein
MSEDAYKVARRAILNSARRRQQKSLDLRGKQLSALPPEIGQLTALESLDLGKNQLTALPPEIGRLAALHSLDVSENRLKTLPPELGQLTALRDLSLRGNRLGRLPSVICQLTALQILDLSANRLDVLPPEIGQLTALQRLNLAANQLKMLPPEIVRLTALHFLRLLGNRLTNLPPEILQLTALIELDLDLNQLTELPPEIGQVTSLERLDLRENMLTDLPTEIGQLMRLGRLDVRNNKLSTLPLEVGQLRGLQNAAEEDFEPLTEGLWVDDNPLPHPYPTLVAGGQPSATVNVLRWLRGELEPQTLPEPDSDPVDSVGTSGIVESAGDDDAEITLRQRPAAFRFRIQNAKIDALPEQPEVADLDVAKDLHAELVAKAGQLRSRLAKTNSDPRTQRSVERLLQALATRFEDVRPGILLSRSRSIEADRNAFDTEEGRREVFPEAVAMVDDVLLSLQDLLAIYPIVRKIEAERLALSIARDASLLDAVTSEADAIKLEASESEVVTAAAIAALRENDPEIEDARSLDVRAGLVADQLLVVRNFVSEIVSYVRRHGAGATAPSVGALRQASNELKELGGKSWEAAKANLPDGVGAAARILPVGLVIVLLASIAGPVAGLAALSGGFKQLAQAIKQLRDFGKLPKGEEQKSEAPRGRRARERKKLE